MIVQTENNWQWPPPYTIRHSKRAKRISLSIRATHGLEVVLPEKKHPREAIAFLNHHREWVEKQALRLGSFVFDNRHIKPTFPEKIELRAISKTYSIVYRPIQSAHGITHQFENERLIFFGAMDDFSRCAPLLVKWLKLQARNALGRLLDQLSLKYQLPYRKLSIRGQKTVWGSCSANKNIQLNYKILFLPESLAHYILVHELCHTIHLNHSANFWKLVAHYIPDFHEQVKCLEKADQWMPGWLGACTNA